MNALAYAILERLSLYRLREVFDLNYVLLMLLSVVPGSGNYVYLILLSIQSYPNTIKCPREDVL